MLMFDACFQNPRKRRWGRIPNRCIWHWRKGDWRLIHAWPARTFTSICSKIVLHIIIPGCFTEFHCLQDIIIIMKFKWCAAKNKTKQIKSTISNDLFTIVLLGKTRLENYFYYHRLYANNITLTWIMNYI